VALLLVASATLDVVAEPAVAVAVVAALAVPAEVARTGALDVAALPAVAT
jgi:hypothetical protein